MDQQPAAIALLHSLWLAANRPGEHRADDIDEELLCRQPARFDSARAAAAPAVAPAPLLVLSFDETLTLLRTLVSEGLVETVAYPHLQRPAYRLKQGLLPEIIELLVSAAAPWAHYL